MSEMRCADGRGKGYRMRKTLPRKAKGRLWPSGRNRESRFGVAVFTGFMGPAR